ncbi:unnamed protein product [Linum trigynum]|uniref:Uncharacterized protein n=1 Tax=Linum trigynum TaxID=586398 RepID=A0AAV2GVB8_9ROSI
MMNLLEGLNEEIGEAVMMDAGDGEEHWLRWRWVWRGTAESGTARNSGGEGAWGRKEEGEMGSGGPALISGGPALISGGGSKEAAVMGSEILDSMGEVKKERGRTRLGSPI